MKTIEQTTLINYLKAHNIEVLRYSTTEVTVKTPYTHGTMVETINLSLTSIQAYLGY